MREGKQTPHAPVITPTVPEQRATYTTKGVYKRADPQYANTRDSKRAGHARGGRSRS